MFKSYLIIDFDLPEDIYEVDVDASEQVWEAIYKVQEEAEEAYIKTVNKGLSKLNLSNIDYEIESK